MSQENLERTRAGWEFVNRTGEINPEVLHPDIVWHTRADLPDTRTYRGPDGVAELHDEWAGTFEEFTVDIEELIDAGEYVVAVLHIHGRISGSSQQLEMAETHVGRWIGGKLVEVREYATKDEALMALGPG